jgi:hypothetical protein
MRFIDTFSSDDRLIQIVGAAFAELRDQEIQCGVTK